MRKRISLPVVSVLAITTIMITVSSNLNWGKNHWMDIIESDAKGYYAYLPAVFIYQDLNFGFFDKIEKQDYYDVNLYYDYRSQANGRTISKYYCGTALAEMPFFLTAHWLSGISGLKTDGYSKLYHIFINIAGLFYLMVGLLYLKATLAGYKFRQWEISLVLFAAVFATNLFYYTACEPGMSHIFSFAFVSMFLFYSREYFSSHRAGFIPVIALSLGMIVLIRPVNGLVIFAWPFAAGSFPALVNGLRQAFRNYGWTLAGIVLFTAIISIQAIIYKISTGSFLVYAYQGEGFNFTHPRMADILFSYKKGLFLYTPVFLLSLTGGFYLWKSARFGFWSWFAFFFLITYVFSSWWMWYYGGSFSSRVYVEYIPFFMVLLAFALRHAGNKRWKYSLVGLIFALMILCQVQTYQYRYYHIHWSDMTREKYWEVFLRIDKLVK